MIAHEIAIGDGVFRCGSDLLNLDSVEYNLSVHGDIVEIQVGYQSRGMLYLDLFGSNIFY